MTKIHTFTQDDQDELDLFFDDKETAEKVKDILENKRLGMMWIEEWEGTYSLRIEIHGKTRSL